MDVKTLLLHWDGDSYLFDVKVTEEGKKQDKVMAEGRALVRTEKVNGRYCGHCCIYGNNEYTTEDCKKQVVTRCIKRAQLLKKGVIEASNKTSEKQLKETTYDI